MVGRDAFIAVYMMSNRRHGTIYIGVTSELVTRVTQHKSGEIKGFTRRYLEIFRQFYLRYPIVQSLIAQFALTLPYASTVPFQPLDWQDDGYCC